MSTEQIIKTLELKFKWMKITKNEKGIYMIEDTRFGPIPFSVMKHSLTESELLEELKPYMENLK